MKHSAFIEFWTDDFPSRFVIRVETDAAPPPPGAVVNIASVDYLVRRVDYSVDQPGEPFPEVRYRRNVYVDEAS